MTAIPHTPQEQGIIAQHAPKYAAFGIRVEEEGTTTHIYKDDALVGSFTMDTERWTLRFNFPNNQFFNYFAYLASDKGINRIEWVNENLTSNTLDHIQAGVAFLGFARFEEEMSKHASTTDKATAH